MINKKRRMEKFVKVPYRTHPNAAGWV